MVLAGYPATVAPLGTGLTEDQRGLLWKMADEPILCFDGDKAGQRAAFRAVDMAMPRLLPGKSLRFAMLPDGQDPDDLYRSGGREAIAEVLAGARPLGEMLWSRETDAASFDTPERRAAFEARVHEVVRSIGDESVRKYYAPDFSGRRRAVLDAATGGQTGDHVDAEGLRAAIAARGLTGVLDRVEAAITHTSDWPAQVGASVDDVAQWWTHVVTLHRKQRTLNRELKDAERALGEEPTDANLAWLRDVQGRLSALDGTEA